jgi:hypothetical protein
MIRNCNDFLSENLLQRENNNKNHLKSVITSDKTWVYSYDVETKQHFFTLEEFCFVLPQESTTGALATESSAHSPQSSKHCAL